MGIGVAGRQVVVVQDFRTGTKSSQLRSILRNNRQEFEQRVARDARPPQEEKYGFQRLLSRLLGLEASPLVPATRSADLRPFQIEHSLLEPTLGFADPRPHALHSSPPVEHSTPGERANAMTCADPRPRGREPASSSFGKSVSSA